MRAARSLRRGTGRCFRRRAAPNDPNMPALLLLTGGWEHASLSWLTYGERRERAREGDTKGVCDIEVETGGFFLMHHVRPCATNRPGPRPQSRCRGRSAGVSPAVARASCPGPLAPPPGPRSSSLSWARGRVSEGRERDAPATAGETPALQTSRHCRQQTPQLSTFVWCIHSKGARTGRKTATKCKKDTK
jgi:hypothetical protein